MWQAGLFEHPPTVVSRIFMLNVVLVVTFSPLYHNYQALDQPVP